MGGAAADVRSSHATLLQPGSYLLPASFTQGARYHRSRDGLVFDNVSLGWRVDGPLDPTVLSASLAEIVRRHEPLRTGIQRVGGSVVQVVSPHAPFSMESVDHTNLAPTQRNSRLLAKSRDDTSRPFLIGTQTPLRVTVVCETHDQHVLLLTANHACWDGWSTTVFLDELQILYTAFASGQRSPLDELAVQFGDYVVWLDDVYDELTTEATKDVGGPWADLDQRAPLGSASRRMLQTHRLPPMSPEATHLLSSVGASRRGTLATILLTALAVSLSHVMGRKEITIAMVEANRDRREATRIIGCLASYLLISTHASTFGSSLLDAHASVRESYARAHAGKLPLARIVPHWSAGVGTSADADLDPPPVFGVILNFMAEPASSGRAIGPLSFSEFQRPAPSPVTADTYWHRAQLIVNVSRAVDGGLEGHVISDPASISAPDAKRLVTELSDLLRATASA